MSHSVKKKANGSNSRQLNFTFRARDPNPEDQIHILLLEDPGLPNEAILDPQVLDWIILLNKLSYFD